MKSKLFVRLLSVLLAVVMVVGVLPASAFAAIVMPEGITVIQDKETTLAPGVKQNTVVALDKNGDRVEMFVASVDMGVDTVQIQANYKDNDASSWGMQLTTEQAAAAEKNHAAPYNVVVAINGSYYNTTTGQPTGAFVMEGKQINSDAAGNAYSFFAILDDGTPLIGNKGEYTAHKDRIVEAIGGYIHLVEDGKIVSGLNDVDKYPRQTIGITADGNVIIMTADGSRQPKTIGLTIKEQAEVMLSLGCVEAVHLDGGGSATYCSKPEGSDKLQVVNNPSNGSERAVSNSLIVVSTAVADGTFDHAVLTAQNEYITPGNKVAISAIGVDAVGGAAELPEEISWQLEDTSFGTVVDGVFTSNGKIGDAVVQMVYNGKVVGNVTIHVVVPTSLSFSRETITIPYGKTVDMGILASYGAYDVAYTAADLNVVVSTGSMNGLAYTAPAEGSGVTSGTVTVTLKNNSAVSASATLKFGKGSDVIFDFEKGCAGADLDNWILRTHESKLDNGEQGELSIVNSETGRVHSGDQALAFHIDYSQGPGSGSNTAGYIAMSLSWGADPISIKGAKSVGFWLYIPEDAMTTEVTFNTVYYDANGNIKRRTVDGNDDNGVYIYTPYWGDNMEKSGWHYIRADLSKLTDDLYIHDEPNLDSAFKRNFFFKIFCVFGQDSNEIASDYNGNFTYYIDDITVDYSDAVDDRELPVFSSGAVCYDNEQIALNYGAVANVGNNSFFVAANVTDNVFVGTNDATVDNAAKSVGLDAASAKIYVDGNLVEATYANGVLSSANFTVPNGRHEIVFEIADKNGNVKQIVRHVNVQGAQELPTVHVVPQDATLDRLLSGSVYWVNVTADNIADIKSVEMLLNLNSINSWELDHMIVADGFDVSWSQTAAQKAENDVRISFTRNDEKLGEGNVIASIPVRVWESLSHTLPGLSAQTPSKLWQSGEINPREVRINVDQGLVTYTDGSAASFSDSITVDTEAYTAYYAMDKEYHAAKGSYHVHTADAVADLAATCTKNGYSGRTFCEVCNSVVDWGTTEAATGHTYKVVDGVLKCACGELFDGVYTDGKEYINGIVAADGWNAEGTKYFVDGMALTGTHIMDNTVYVFGENGIYDETASSTYMGLVEYEGDLYYAQLGKLVSGWQFAPSGLVDDDPDDGIYYSNTYYYYFDPVTFKAFKDGLLTVDGYTYEFKDSILIDGQWVVGPDGTLVMYWAGGFLPNGWNTIKDKTYYVIYLGAVARGVYCIEIGWSSGIFEWHLFDENGVWQRELDGLYGQHFYIEGERVPAYYGLVQWNGDYYYVNDNAAIVKDVKKYVSKTNGLTWADGTAIESGYYEFDAEGKLVIPEKEEPEVLNGLVGNFYYVNGEKVPAYYGLVQWEGNYYYVNDYAAIVKNVKKYVSKTNGLTWADGTAIESGYYEFDAEGKLVIPEKEEPEVLNGLVGNFYYVNGEKVPAYYGLVQWEGNYYYVNDYAAIVKNVKKYVSKTNGLTWADGTAIESGYYEFDAEGKMIIE